MTAREVARVALSVTATLAMVGGAFVLGVLALPAQAISAGAEWVGAGLLLKRGGRC